MDQYFDAHLYVANWGTRRLMLRLPVRAFPLATAKPYAVPYVLKARATKEHVVLDFISDISPSQANSRVASLRLRWQHDTNSAVFHSSGDDP